MNARATDRPSGKHAARTHRLDLAQTQAELPLELAMEFRFGQADDAGGFLRLLGPDDRGTVAQDRIAFQRQDRKGSGREEMLLRTPAVIALVRDGGDDRRLTVAPAMTCNSGSFTDPRLRAIGRNQQPRRQRAAVRKPDFYLARRAAPRALPLRQAAAVAVGVGELETRDRVGHERDTRFTRLCQQRAQERAILDHVRERLPWLQFAGEGEEGRPNRILQPAVGHDHIENGLRLDLVPDPDRLEHPAGGGDDGRSARIGHRASQDRIGDRHRERLPEALAQSDRQRQAGKAGPADQHVDTVRGDVGR